MKEVREEVKKERRAADERIGKQWKREWKGSSRKGDEGIIGMRNREKRKAIEQGNIEVKVQGKETE